MPLIRWLNRHGWIFSLTGLLCTAAVLYYIAPLLLTRGNAVPVFLWLLKELLVIALIAALCRGLLQGSKSLWLSAGNCRQYGGGRGPSRRCIRRSRWRFPSPSMTWDDSRRRSRS